MTRTLLAWRFVFAATLVAVTWLLLAPSSATPAMPLFPFADKLYHVALLGALALSAGLAWPPVGWRHAAWLLAYAAATELGQLVSPGRSTDALDLAADALGVAAGLAVAAAGARLPKA